MIAMTTPGISLSLAIIFLLASRPVSQPGSPAVLGRASSSEPGQSTAVPSNTGSRVPPDQAQLALDFQNAKRRDVDAPPLEWSADLAASAQSWADHLAADRNCGLEHTVNNKYGENLFAGSGRAFTALDAAEAWYGEIKDYHYGVLTAANFSQTGHYTQMVWSRTTKVGMGQATCSGGAIAIVAEYDPPGNYIGQKPY
jgi:pathogenesis-related protein 1